MHIDTTIKKRNVMGNLSIYLIAKGNIRLRNMNAYSANRKILVNVILWIGFQYRDMAPNHWNYKHLPN